MAKKNEQGSLFEIVVVLSIVFIVAFTGQILIHFESQGKTGRSGITSSDRITGFVVGDNVGDFDWGSANREYLDLAIEDVEINPLSPSVGEPFDIKVKMVNQGLVETGALFYVRLEIVPLDGSGAPTILFTPMTKSLKPGEESGVSFRIAMITQEGPLKITATADSTSKLDDKNLRNNQRSTTVIITSQ